MPSRDSIANLAAHGAVMDRVKQAMVQAHALGGRTGEECAARWTKNICFYLYKRCREFSPTADQFYNQATGIAPSHGWKIADLKHHSKQVSKWSRTRVMDIMRQRGRHRLFIASGWLAVKKIASKAGERLQTQSLRNGRIDVSASGGLFTSFRVSIINTSEAAREFHVKHNITELALEDEERDLADYIARKKQMDVETVLKGFR